VKKYSLLLLLYSQLGLAADVINIITQNTSSQNSTLVSTTIGKAADWNLNETEWKHYLTLMQGPSGRYYPHLTPLEVLGINADNPEDLKHFAELSVLREHEKVEKELRFNAAFQEAANRLYSEEPVIKPFDFSHYSTIEK